MNLKDLEFKAEDFVHISYLIDGKEFIHIKDAAMVANHLLRDRLEKAPTIHACDNYDGWQPLPPIKICPKCHSQAKIVCIEKVK